MKIKSLQLIAVMLLLLASCNPGDDNSGSSTTDEQFAQNFGASAQRDFIGQVVDKDNNPIVGATVTIGSSTVLTDANGVFTLNDAPAYEKFAYITAEKSGFIKGSRSLVPTSGKNNVKIMLIPATPTATISSGTTADVDLPNGTKVTFDGAFQTEDGSNYSGDVSVSMFHLEPSDENISSLMPGMLYAKGSDGEAKVLETFGMLNVELRGSAGQKLQIKSGHKAQISMKIDDSQTAMAPNSIPLWHFDEAVGYWKQEGSATKQGNFYVGEVSHFSWWNCDTFSATAILTVTVTSNGTPLSNIGVSLVVNSSGFASTILVTDQNGQASGVIPMNQTMTLTIRDACGNIVHTEEIGPYSGDATHQVSLNPPQFIATTITGQLVDCNGAPVTDGYVVIRQGAVNLFAVVTDGSFSFQTVVCGNGETFTLNGYDIEHAQTTGELSFVFSTGTTDIGILPVCNAVEEFAWYHFDDEPIVYITDGNALLVDASLTWAGFTLNYGSNQEHNYFGITCFPMMPVPGTSYPGISQLGMQLQAYHEGTTENVVVYGGPTSGSNNTMVFTVGAYAENVGDFIDVSFNGTVEFDGQSRPLKGAIHVKRDN